MLAKMIEEGDAEYFTLQKQEDVFEVEYDSYEPNCVFETRDMDYPAIYMRSYWTAPSEATYNIVVSDILSHIRDY